MKWFWHQLKGALSKDGEVVAHGYAGCEQGINNPACQFIENFGPIPQGLWLMVSIFDSPELGPYCIRLLAAEHTYTADRSGFLVHGDSKAHAGERVASKGCIILPRAARIMLWQSEEHQLLVVP